MTEEDEKRVREIVKEVFKEEIDKFERESWVLLSDINKEGNNGR